MRSSALGVTIVCLLAISECRGGFTVPISRSVILALAGEDKAAAELKTHLDLMSGLDVNVVSNEADVSQGAFVWEVGMSASEGASPLAPEECRWRISRSGASFFGEGSKGAMFAVTSFLEDELGVRWPSGTNIVCQPRTELVFSKDVLAGGWKPALKNREIRCSTREGCVWSNRMRMGRHDYPNYGHAFVLYWDRFSRSHPEYFAMRKDGKRFPVGKEAVGENAQLFTGSAKHKIAMCVTAPGLVDQVIADWCAKGTNAFVNVCENDASGKDVCYCESCRALDEPPPADMLPNWVTCYADRYVDFARRVLVRARSIRPDARVCFYGYNPSEQPPRRERLDSGMLVGLVPVEFGWKQLTDYIAGWKKMGLAEFFYRPNRHWHYRMRNLPMGSEEYFFRVWRMILKAGATGFDYDSPGPVGETEWFRDYVLAKAMQDTSRDFAHWENHYFLAYGPAAEDVKAYYRYWREAVWPKIEHDIPILTRKGGFNVARALLRTLGDYYCDEDFHRAEGLVWHALARPGLEGPSKNLVERLAVAHKHAALLFAAAKSKRRVDLEALRTFRLKYGFEMHPNEESGIVDIPREEK